jgi:hypothetical protein
VEGRGAGTDEVRYCTRSAASIYAHISFMLLVLGGGSTHGMLEANARVAPGAVSSDTMLRYYAG